MTNSKTSFVQITSNKKPTLTPFEALQRFNENEGKNFDHEGFRYILDGPFMSPSDFWAPEAVEIEGEENFWFTTGEPGDEVTTENEWIN